MAYVKKHAIRNLESPTAAQDLDDNFESIFATLRALKSSVSALQDDANAEGIVGRDGVVGPPGEDGQAGEDGPPGIPGAQGAAGITGAAGPVTLGPMGLDGIDGDEGMAIPGPVGPTGATGAVGPQGPTTIGPMGIDGCDGEDGWTVPASTSGGGGGWTLIATTTAAGAGNYDFTSLGNYGAILVVTRSITKSASGVTQLLVSTDNGSTFLTTSGDYLALAAAGTTTNDTAMDFHATASTAARSGRIIIWGFNTIGQKAAHTTASVLNYLIPTTTALNAVRVVGSAGGTLDAGTIYVYGS